MSWRAMVYTSGSWFWLSRLKWYVKLTYAERYLMSARVSERLRKHL
jgi:hypothetical protein